MEYLYGSDEVGTTLKIVGVLRPDPDAANSMVRGSLGYTSALTQYVAGRRLRKRGHPAAAGRS